jgi:hypothetical protein
MVNAERVYNSFSAVGTGIYCSLFCRNSSNVYYSKWCQNCHNIFGCVWLANKKYCIFNKQYSPEEYSHRMTEIIELMMTQWERWDFPYMWDFWYNESLAMEHFPLSKEEALRRWFSRQDKEITINIPDHIEAKDISVIPDSIVDIDDSVLEDVYVCPETWKPFRIISSELAFYHKNNIPLPRVHQDVRYAINRAYIPSRDFYLRTCDITWEEVFSIFSENSPYKVVNNETYDKAMYW